MKAGKVVLIGLDVGRCCGCDRYVTADEYCFGCHEFVCAACDENPQIVGDHTKQDHLIAGLNDDGRTE